MLSKKCQYALHALQFLAENAEKGPFTIQAIADHKGIPKKFLESILLTLRDADIICSKKGKEGGYWMARHPDEISLAQVILLMDRSLTLLPCLHGDEKYCVSCHNIESCLIHAALQGVQEAIVRKISRVTVADIILKQKTTKTRKQTHKYALSY